MQTKKYKENSELCPADWAKYLNQLLYPCTSPFKTIKT
jgi:hypothetical protein